MTKEELRNELKKVENASPAYSKLENASDLFKNLTKAILIIGAVSSIILWIYMGLVYFVTTLISTLLTSGFFYALSAIIYGIATIVHNTACTKNLLKFQIMTDNDSQNK